MNGFKLLAIRPLEGCDPKFLKNLKEGMIYKFYQDYEYFILENKVQVKLTHNNYEKFKGVPIESFTSLNEEQNLYSSEDLKINISAVVGENGSGKSALTEIFLKAMFDLSIQEEWITEKKLILQNQTNQEYNNNQVKILEEQIKNLLLESDSETKEEKLSELGKKRSEFAQRNLSTLKYQKRLEKFKKSSLCFELIFNNSEGETIIIKKLKGVETILIAGVEPKGEKLKFSSIFYTIFLNYSIYGLNGKDIGKWIDYLYHKNDGYQTPVVINPQKSNGNIDVNREEELSKYRINRSAFESGKILDLKITKVRFSLKERYTNYEVTYNWETDSLFVNIVPEIAEYKFHNEGKSNLEFLSKLFGQPTNDTKLTSKPAEEDVSEEEKKMYDDALSEIVDFIAAYFIGKLFKTDKLYGFNKFVSSADYSGFELNQVTNYCIETIWKSKSHKHLKLKQLIDVFKNKLKIATEILLASKDDKWMEFDEFQQMLDLIQDPDLLISLSSIFEIDYQFEDRSQYSKFSSGQKQFVNTIETVNYHLRNLVSNENEYNSFNIILDEVELYFHPEYQRQLIKKMIDSINRLGLPKDSSINILFLTHSPFILSDIPSSNILKLKDGLPINEENQTFGANIHDLLANDFFLENGFMGEFAKIKISEIIEELQGVIEAKISILPKRLTEIEKIIQIIGEPLLTNSLNSLYAKAYPESKNDFLQFQIDKLLELQNLK
ncbi:hypothetical protein [Fluviicola taffensis]|nr:hypothetical protein [Fluviicola taffensis]